MSIRAKRMDDFLTVRRVPWDSQTVGPNQTPNAVPRIIETAPFADTASRLKIMKPYSDLSGGVAPFVARLMTDWKSIMITVVAQGRFPVVDVLEDYFASVAIWPWGR